jgi:GNAT superfamily N-acetyltransferase
MTVRRATADDAEELARLRLAMFDDMGVDYGPDLLARCVDGFQERLVADDFAAYVVEAGPRLAAAGSGWLTVRLPDPRTSTWLRGYVASMYTDPAHRRRGHARAVVAALLAWFAAQGAEPVELNATEMGAPLYASFGFVPVTTAWMLPSLSRNETASSTVTPATDKTTAPSGSSTNA